MSKFCLGIQRAITKVTWRDSDMVSVKKEERKERGSL